MKTPAFLFATAALVSTPFAAAVESADSVSLFNGKDLTGWKGAGYVIEDGAIVSTPQARTLVTESTYANYVLDFEFKLTPGANNGLGIHYPGTGDSAYTGMEIQVLDSTHPKYKDLKAYQFHGSLYTLAPAKQGFLKPVGEWNKQRVTIAGPHVKVELNGIIILEENLDDLASKHPQHQGVKRRAGHIAFLGHGDKVFYRNINIAELPPAANKDAVISQGFLSLTPDEKLAGWKHSPETKNWKVINGILKHDGTKTPTKDLWTEKSYGDFTLVLDWRWSGRGPMKQQPVVKPDGTNEGTAEIEELDSGVYFRGGTKSQVNFWNWTVGSGEVYGYRTDGSMPPEIRAGVTPKLKADKPQGEWNRTMITVRGDRLSVELNGKKVIESAKLPNLPAKGPIGLQHHGAAIDFANMWIKEF